MNSVLITGGAKRLGAAMARHLAARGFDIVISYRSSAEDASALIKEITGHGVKAIALKADLMERDDLTRLVPDAVAALGKPLTHLVNNASLFEYDSFESASFETWDRAMRTNLEAPFFLSQAFAAQAPKALEIDGEMKAQSAILNMIDMRVRRLTPNFASYTLAKSALWTLTQTSAQGFAPNIRVNAIGPGSTLKSDEEAKELFSARRRRSILERGANTDDILRTLDYLFDSPAVTGQLICVDGGQHLIWQFPELPS